MIQCIVKRLPEGKLLLIQGILNSITLLSEYFAVPPLCYAGMPPLQIELTTIGLDEYITWLDRVDQFVPKAFILASHDYKPKLEVFVDRNSEVEILRFQLSSESEKVLQIDSLCNFLTKLWSSFSAFNIYTHDDRNLSNFYDEYFLRGDEFDNRQVPRGIWWINAWSCLQVETIGRDRVKGAPWSKIVELPDDSMILAATESLTNMEEQSLIRLRSIAKCIKLRTIQRQWLLSEPSIYAIYY